MTAEHTEPGVPNEITTFGRASQTGTPELKAIIREVLEKNDGYCMDEPEERERLGHALTAALTPLIQGRIKTSQPDDEAAT